MDRHLDGLVHRSAAADPLARARHRGFIAANLACGLLALVVLPIHLALVGPAGLVEAVALAALAAPAPIALWVSRTGRIDAGHTALAVAATALVVWVAASTGGLGSVSLLWLALVPIEAALAGSRPVVLRASLVAAAGLATVAGLHFAGLLPPPRATIVPPEFAVALASAMGVLFAGTLALRIDRLHRVGEAEVKSREDHYRIVAENISDVVSGHGRNGDVLFASPAITRVFGLAVAEALGDGFFRRIHVADRPAYLTALSRAMVDGVPAEVEFRVRAEGEDGAAPAYVWAEMRCRPIGERDPLTDVAEVIAVTRDISVRKAQEEELERARAAAEDASHAKTRFLANVSHELRTPLNAIIGFSDILQSEIFGRLDDPRQREYVRLIHESGAHLLQVVNDILDMSKIESGKFDIVVEPFEAKGFVDTTLAMMSHQAELAGLKLTAAVDPALPEVHGDRRALKQVLLNLLSNAIKFTRPGGSVRVVARREIGVFVLEVADDGIGISETDLPRLCVPFVQADSGYDRRHEGTGLGLSMVKGLVELHGGRLAIASRLGEGTTVTVRVPLAGPPRVEPEPVVVPLAPRLPDHDPHRRRA